MASPRNAPRVIWPRRVLVVSLLVQSPAADETTAEPAPAGVTALAASWRRQDTAAEPAPGATTRARTRRRRLASATAAALPEEILVWEIFVRLPSNDILQCRAVCRYWHGLTSDPEFLLAHHRRQPSRLLLTRYGTASPEPTFQRAHPVLGLDDDIGFTIHTSCDGLLLVSFAYGRFTVCNPATRQCAPLPCLTAADRRINTAALYIHRPSDEYRVLYWNRTRRQGEVVYYIVMVWRGRSPRCISLPPDTPRVKKAMMACDGTAPPVAFRNCLHWEPACSDTGILVFDTLAESFRLMRRPAAATRLFPRLCDMGGSIGFSCFEGGRKLAKIWVLEDYEREVWSFKYRVELPAVESLHNLEDSQHLVLSHEGDMLVYSPSSGDMFHCDNTGKLLEQFQCHPWSRELIGGPWFKESLVKHNFFPRRGCAWVGQLLFF